MKRIFYRFPILLPFLLILVSCTPQKKLIYFKNIEEGKQYSVNQFVYRLQYGDVLYVSVYSINEQAAQLFSSTGKSVVNMQNDMSAYLHGFVINESGEINLPLVGMLKVSGLTIEQTALLIQEQIREYFYDAVVDVKLLSFQITILGEVNKPGTYRVNYPRINIFEAIGLAGDLNVYGKRDITLVRETSEGVAIFKMDLKDRNIMAHECYYLLPNDIIYVEPHKAKVFGFNTVPITLLFTTISSLILILNYINN